jgi:undecaprenyl-diphosphatase
VQRSPDTPDDTPERVRAALERELAQVRSPEEAEAILRRIAELTQGATEQTAADAAAQAARPPAAEIDATAQRIATPETEAAAVLSKTAAEAVAPTPEAAAVVEGAQEALGTRPAPGVPAPSVVRRGRQLLKDAVLRQMDPLHRLDAQIYLAVNRLPHSPAADRFANYVTVLTVGGWIWMVVVGVAALFGVPGSRRALREIVPIVAGATWIVEYPTKTLFRRRRPFIDIVRALVVGKKPGSWSFPSGHTAAAFATALVMSGHWRRLTPVFYAAASGIGFSRVYVGAHYPGDVASGALLGTALAEVLRLGVRAGLARVLPERSKANAPLPLPGA